MSSTPEISLVPKLGSEKSEQKLAIVDEPGMLEASSIPTPTGLPAPRKRTD
jgi:hypothetical protein